MSTATAAAAAAAAVERQTYWCHECDMSISLLSSATAALLCPYCHSDFLEELDNPTNPIPNPSPDPNNANESIVLDPLFPSFLSPPENLTDNDNNNNNFPFPSTAAHDDNYLLDSPYLHRLIRELATHADTSAPIPPHHNPTSKSAIESIPTITITDILLESNPVILCAVCKDQFVIDVEAKQLPCNHMYHPDCILPWLKMHNSCPVCRFTMPTESDGGSKGRRRRDRINARLGELMGEEEFYGFGSTLRHIARRHRMEMVEGGGESLLLSPTRVAEADIGVLARENSVETVSSGWPSWPTEEGGDEEIGMSGRENDGGDIIMS